MKSIIRILITLLAILVAFFKRELEFYDIIIFAFLLIGLIINYLKIKDKKYTIDAVTNYVFWTSMILLIFYLKGLDLFNYKDVFFILIILKSIVFIINYLKFKKVLVPSSIISKIWIFTLFIYLSELILNSTHGTKNICLVMGIISCIESVIIITGLKEWRPKISSLFNLKNK